MNTSRLCFGLAMAACLAVSAVPSAAQTTSSAVRGTIRDADGAGLESVDVVATDLSSGYAYRGLSGPGGRFWIRGLPPGTYSLTGSRIGLRDTSVDSVQVPIGRMVQLDMQMEASPLALAGLAVSVRPNSVATGAGVSFVINQREIQRVPEESRRFIDLVQYTPGATGATENGSTARFGESAPTVGALNAQSLGVVVDGADFTEPALGELSGSIPLLAIQEFEVVQARYSAEYGRAASGMVNVVTRHGSNEFEAKSFGLFRDASLTAKGAFETETPDYGRYHVGALLAGPIVRDQTHYFTAFERRRENSYATVNTGGAFPASEGSFLTPFEDNLLFARLDHRPNDQHQFTFSYAGEFGNRLSLKREVGTPVAIEHGVNTDLSMNSFNLSHRWMFSPDATNEVRVHLIRRDLRNKKNAPPGPALVYPSLTKGPFFATTRYRSSTLEVMDEVMFVREASGTHELKVGAQVAFVNNSDIKVRIFDDGAFLFTSDNAPLPLAGQVLIDDGIGLSQRNTLLSAYIQDDWRVNDNLTINLGVRYDVETNGSNQNYVSEYAGLLPFIPTEPRKRDIDNVAPRIGFSYDLDGTNRSVIRGGAGIYFDALASYPLLALERSSGSRTAVVFFPGTTDVSALNIDPAKVPPDIWPVGAIETPSTRQLSLGFQHTLTPGLRLSVDGMVVQGRNLLLERQINTITPGSRIPRYPQFSFIGQVLSAGKADAKMIMTSLDGTFERTWFRLGYTLAKRTNTNDIWNSFVPQVDPADEDFSGEVGPAAWDERHRVTATAGVRLADRFALSVKAVYASARPYTALTGTDDNGDRDLAGFNDRPAGEGRNARRGPDFFQADVGVRWDVEVGGVSGAVMANVYNVLNHTNLRPESVVNLLTSPLFGQATDAFPKRQLEVGFEVGHR